MVLCFQLGCTQEQIQCWWLGWWWERSCAPRGWTVVAGLVVTVITNILVITIIMINHDHHGWSSCSSYLSSWLGHRFRQGTQRQTSLHKSCLSKVSWYITATNLIVKNLTLVLVSGSSGSGGGGGGESFDSVVTETKIHRAAWSWLVFLALGTWSRLVFLALAYFTWGWECRCSWLDKQPLRSLRYRQRGRKHLGGET